MNKIIGIRLVALLLGLRLERQGSEMVKVQILPIQIKVKV